MSEPTNLAAYRNVLIALETKSQTEYDRLVVALSGGALGISFAFVERFVGDDPPLALWTLMAAWVAWVCINRRHREPFRVRHRPRVVRGSGPVIKPACEPPRAPRDPRRGVLVAEPSPPARLPHATFPSGIGSAVPAGTPAAATAESAFPRSAASGEQTNFPGRKNHAAAVAQDGRR